MKIHFPFFFGLWILLTLSMNAQQKDVIIQDNFDGQPITRLLQTLSPRYGITVFYVDEWVDSVVVRQSEQPMNLLDILRASLSQTSVSWFTDPAGRIILSKNRILSDSLTFSIRPPEILRPSNENESFVSSFRPAITAGNDSASTTNKAMIEIGGESPARSSKVTLAGYVRDEENGEPLPGAVVMVESLRIGVNTDTYGYYSLTLPKGKHELIFRSYGKEEVKQQVSLLGDGALNMQMRDDIHMLDEVVIEAERAANVQGAQMGVTRLGIESLQQMPAFMGEVDIVKSALLLPGVQSVGEGASGFNVRGGTASQNLVLINQAPVFNTSHLFGFFSVFNPDIVKSFDLYKSGIPARFGGRLASVLDITMKDGNSKEWVASGGISPVTARATVEGPLFKGKSSVILGARSTYSNWILRQFNNAAIRNSEAAFNDFNGKLNIGLNEKNRMDISGYFSRDYFLFNEDTTYNYQNLNGTLSWKHLFNNRLYAVTSAIFSQYNYKIDISESPETSFQVGYQIRYQEGKTDFTFIPGPKHQIRMGVNAIRYDLSPGNRFATDPASLVSPQALENEQGIESGIYLSDEFDVGSRWKIYAGLRYSWYGMLGPQTIYNYLSGASRKVGNLTDSTMFSSGSLVQSYGGPEFRLTSRFNLDEKSSIKLGYNRMRQYLHMLSNTTSISPSDTWKLSDPYIRPQVGDQLSLGYYRNFRQNSIETSVEIYVKSIANMLEFKSGAQLLLNQYVETAVVSGLGKAYGAEFLIRKDRGKLNGWVSYTYARTLIRVKGNYPDEIINRGQYYPATVDKPHDFSLVANYRFSRRFNFSSNFAWNTGRPITYPVALYQFGNGTRLSYSQRNQFRVPDYFRWDVSMNLEGNHKVEKFVHNSLSLAVYNVLGRRNVYSIYFVTETKGVQGYKLSIFGRPIFTATYNFTIK
ncbi:MAG: TonB-dependent receptor [Bacteroidia bacterium]